MKVKITNPNRHINVTEYAETIKAKRHGVSEYCLGDPQDKIDSAIDAFFDGLQSIVNVTVNSWRSETKNYKVKVDYHDTWSCDITFATIIAPVLKEYLDQLLGAPFVDDEDLPDHLKITDGQLVDGQDIYSLPDQDINKHMQRWEYVVNEMIYAFEQIKDDNIDTQFIAVTGYGNGEFGSSYSFDTEGYREEVKRIQNGLNLFAKYYFSLWN